MTWLISRADLRELGEGSVVMDLGGDMLWVLKEVREPMKLEDAVKAATMRAREEEEKDNNVTRAAILLKLREGLELEEYQALIHNLKADGEEYQLDWRGWTYTISMDDEGDVSIYREFWFFFQTYTVNNCDLANGADLMEYLDRQVPKPDNNAAKLY